MYAIGRENAKRTNVCRKNGIIINDGRRGVKVELKKDNLTTEEVRMKREANIKKFGLTKEQIDRVVIPKLTEKQTSEVFDKKTNEQLERDQLLSRLAILRSALEYIKNGSSDVIELYFYLSYRARYHRSVVVLGTKRGDVMQVKMT